ncbi:hypothetical protein BDZ45DRAFT_725209 [Acephala macrosclerotiorum]|nr:hypothetical protein BDZ45DRAFT_725209 [Acephala macrosclerotiorum]
MDQDERESMLTVLRSLARKLGPLERKEHRWGSLRGHLTERFNEKYLDKHSTTILDLFHDCLDSIGSSSTTSANSYRQTAPPDATLAASLLSSTSAMGNDPSSFIKVDDGFIQTTTALQGARFSYSDREDNLVGWHILKRYDLVSEVKNNRVTLTFFLQSRRKRTYKLEFKTKRKASFDVQLGSRWEDEGEELEEKFTRLKMRPNQTQVARNNAAAGVDPSAQMIPSEYVVSVLLGLWNGSCNDLAKDRTFSEPQAVIAPPISMPLPIVRPETGMRGTRQGSKVERVASPISFESRAYEAESNKTSRMSPRPNRGGHASNASTSNSDLSDGFDHDHEDERDKCSESSAPDNIDDEGRDPASYEDDFQPPLSCFWGRSLEEECYENPWMDDHG